MAVQCQLPRFSARTVGLGKIDGAAWDAFAEQCDCSTRSTVGHSMAWGLKNLGRHKVRFLEIFAIDAAGEHKVGQCAVAIGRTNIFLDRLQLLEPTEANWSAAMRAVLARTGPGAYEYGWVLNMEPPRQEVLRNLPKVAVTNVWPLTVHAIDFRKWPTWDAYYRGMSENSRRNEKVALRDLPDLRLDLRAGLSCLSSIPALIRLRSSMTMRKGLRHSAVSSIASYIGTIVSCQRYVFTGVSRDGQRELSSFYGATFGANTYYLEGGSRPDNHGAAWHLLISILRRSYEQNPTGRFVMGYIDRSTHDEAASGGLLRSRAACRVSDYPTSVIDFHYG